MKWSLSWRLPLILVLSLSCAGLTGCPAGDDGGEPEAERDGEPIAPEQGEEEPPPSAEGQPDADGEPVGEESREGQSSPDGEAEVRREGQPAPNEGEAPPTEGQPGDEGEPGKEGEFPREGQHDRDGEDTGQGELPQGDGEAEGHAEGDLVFDGEPDSGGESPHEGQEDCDGEEIIQGEPPRSEGEAEQLAEGEGEGEGEGEPEGGPPVEGQPTLEGGIPAEGQAINEGEAEPPANEGEAEPPTHDGELELEAEPMPQGEGPMPEAEACEAEPEGEREPEEGQPEAEPEGQPGTEAEQEGQPEPEGQIVADGEPSGEGQGTMDGETEGEGQPSIEAEPDGEGESEGEAEPQLGGEPVFEGASEGEGQPSIEAEPDGEGESEGEAEPQLGGEPVFEGASEGEGQPSIEAEPDGESESEGEAEPQLGGEPVFEGASEGEGQPSIEAEPDGEGESEGEAEPSREGDPPDEGSPEGQVPLEAEADGEPEDEGEPIMDGEAEPEGQVVTEGEGEHSIEGQSIADGEPEGEVDTTSPDMVSVDGGTFEMGDPWLEGFSYELPVHEVTLSPYQIGKYEVTNQELCDVYNWAENRGYLTADQTVAMAFGKVLMDLDGPGCLVKHWSSGFLVKYRDGYSMADHPVVEISWYGAAAYCNWLSERQGLDPCYDTSTWACDFTKNGYHLPTEAQWERAAAWDSSYHYRFGTSSDIIRCDTVNYERTYECNPLGLTSKPYTSPVGYYTGVTSPAGCYDMTGNVTEWCNDWQYREYTEDPVTDPKGPNSGSSRVTRGGPWSSNAYRCRAAYRYYCSPSGSSATIGFRLARSGNEDQEEGELTPAEGDPSAGEDDPEGEGPLPEGEGDITPGEMVSIPAGTFEMGDPWNEGDAEEVPVHDVTLSAYQIGMYEVTNQEYADILNWANARGYLDTASTSEVWADGQQLVNLEYNGWSQLTWTDSSFVADIRDGYSMADHPVVMVSWYGAAAYCNWLSERQGLDPCYDTSTWACDITKNGYHLPTEAQWERAAAWDGSYHYRYGNGSDDIRCTTVNSVNYNGDWWFSCNPLDLSGYPYTSPVGYYTGVTSPAGCYDMSGNVKEWCNDWWYREYAEDPVTDPEGPSSGSKRVKRGGGWSTYAYLCSSTHRAHNNPWAMGYEMGFRLSRSVPGDEGKA